MGAVLLVIHTFNASITTKKKTIPFLLLFLAVYTNFAARFLQPNEAVFVVSFFYGFMLTDTHNVYFIAFYPVALYRCQMVLNIC